MAHRFIRAWAKQRGIYSSKFGYLGGFHITLMLSQICKLLFRDAGAITAADIICTFFNHYASFNWKTHMAFDPFFYKQPRYRRSPTEPMVILSLHAPSVNVAHTASFPSVKTLISELKRADDLLSVVGVTWPRLIGGRDEERTMADLPSGADEFLNSHNSYIKINVQYWGLSLAKGSTLVGWLESKCVKLLVGMF
jgi:poly(A) polymerase Pap1